MNKLTRNFIRVTKLADLKDSSLYEVSHLPWLAILPRPGWLVLSASLQGLIVSTVEPLGKRFTSAREGVLSYTMKKISKLIEKTMKLIGSCLRGFANWRGACLKVVSALDGARFQDSIAIRLLDGETAQRHYQWKNWDYPTSQTPLPFFQSIVHFRNISADSPDSIKNGSHGKKFCGVFKKTDSMDFENNKNRGNDFSRKALKVFGKIDLWNFSAKKVSQQFDKSFKNNFSEKNSVNLYKNNLLEKISEKSFFLCGNCKNSFALNFLLCGI